MASHQTEIASVVYPGVHELDLPLLAAAVGSAFRKVHHTVNRRKSEDSSAVPAAEGQLRTLASEGSYLEVQYSTVAKLDAFFKTENYSSIDF